jgi:RNA polymerase-binding transcription factor DksA
MAKKKASSELRFPANLVAPVGEFLTDQLKRLERNKAKIEEGDPFIGNDRLTDNAAIDTEAEEQFGHAMTTAVKDRIDKKIIQTRKALSRLKIGKYGICESCGNMIDTDRLVIYPEATVCVNCQKKKKKR